jgi:hypothetical protein
MDLIDDVDLEPTIARHVLNIFTELTDFINSSVRGAIDFKHVYGNPMGNFVAQLARIAWRWSGAPLAVHGFGHDPCNRGLTNTPGASKQMGMGYSVSLDGVSERLSDVILSNNLFKGLGAIFSCQYKVRHSVNR